MSRPAIVSITEDDDGEHALVGVTLAWQDEEFHGEATGARGARNRPRLVGEATLRAVEEVTDRIVRLRLTAVATIDLAGAQVAMAQVSLEGDDGPFVGSALLEGPDASGATVKAVLDAINRRIGLVL
jgi:hypothetical protein